MIVEDDECGGCSWCPVVVDDREEDRQAAVDCWKRGEQFRSGKQWGEALELYARGVVANPSNAKCWVGISRVSQEWYLEAFETCNKTYTVEPVALFLASTLSTLICILQIELANFLFFRKELNRRACYPVYGHKYMHHMRWYPDIIMLMRVVVVFRVFSRCCRRFECVRLTVLVVPFCYQVLARYI